MQKSISSVLWIKFLETLERSSWEDIAISIAKVVCWSFISIFLINVPESVEKLAIAIKWHDFAIVKIISAFFLVYFAKNIISMIQSFYFWILESLPETQKTPIHGPMYKNIPVVELVDYILTASSYSRSEFCEHFGVSRKVFDDLAEGFDKIGVFTRGANNARVLSSEYGRGDIASILTRASETGEIRPLIREIKGGFTHSPTFRTVSLSEFRKMAS